MNLDAILIDFHRTLNARAKWEFDRMIYGNTSQLMEEMLESNDVDHAEEILRSWVDFYNRNMKHSAFA